MVKWIIYYVATLSINILAAFILNDYINITVMSLVPIAIIALMLFQALHFRSERVENGFKTAYGSNFTSKEENKLFDYISNSLLITIPFLIPFALFFSLELKILSLLLYVLGFIIGGAVFRIKNGKSIRERVKEDENSLKNQEQNEELGNWK